MAIAKNAPKRGPLPAEGVTGAEYEVLKTSLINNRIVHKGAVVKYDGVPGEYLLPLNAEAKAAKKQADAIRANARDAVIKTETLDGNREAQRQLRELDNTRRGVNDRVIVEDESLSAAERKPLEAAAEQTRKDTLEASQEAGGVLVQMTGTQPETVIPTDGTGVAPEADLKAAAAKTGKK